MKEKEIIHQRVRGVSRMSKERWRNAAILTIVMSLMLVVVYFSIDTRFRDNTTRFILVVGCLLFGLFSVLMQWILNSSETKAYAIKNGYELIHTTEEGHEIWCKKTETQVFIKELDSKGFDIATERRYDKADLRNMALLNRK